MTIVTDGHLLYYNMTENIYNMRINYISINISFIYLQIFHILYYN